MLTQGQLKDLVLDALAADTALTALVGQRIDWIGNTTEADIFPKIEYTVFDTDGSYAFGDSKLEAVSEDYTFQLNIYADPNSSAVMDDIVERVKAVMVDLCFRNSLSPGEFLDDDINKVVRPMRWEYINV